MCFFRSCLYSWGFDETAVDAVEHLRMMVITTLALNLESFKPLVELNWLVDLRNRSYIDSDVFLVVASITRKPVLLLGDNRKEQKISKWFEPVDLPFPASCPPQLTHISCTVIMWDMNIRHFHGVRIFGQISQRPESAKHISVGQFPEP